MCMCLSYPLVYCACKNYIGSVYVGGYCGLSESPVYFLVVCKCSSALLQSIVMSLVDGGDVG